MPSTVSVQVACQRCGQLLDKIGKYCADCQELIARVRNSKKSKEDKVLTTTDQKIIEQKHQAAPPPRPPAPPRPPIAVGAPSGKLRWRITGRVVVVEEKTIEVVADGPAEALAALRRVMPDLELTQLLLLD